MRWFRLCLRVGQRACLSTRVHPTAHQPAVWHATRIYSTGTQSWHILFALRLWGKKKFTTRWVSSALGIVANAFFLFGGLFRGRSGASGRSLTQHEHARSHPVRTLAAISDCLPAGMLQRADSTISFGVASNPGPLKYNVFLYSNSGINLTKGNLAQGDFPQQKIGD